MSGGGLMRESILSKIMIFAALAVVSLIARIVIYEAVLAKPLGDMNKQISKQMEEAARNIDAMTPPPQYSTRNEFRNDAEWEESAFRQSSYTPPPDMQAGQDDADKDAKKVPALVPPPSSWVLFASDDAGGNRIMHARLPLTAPDGTPMLIIELSQPQPAHGDDGAAAQIIFTAVTQASCTDADALVLRFDNAPAVRYPVKGVWEDAKCHFGLPGFSAFRDSVVNTSTLFVRLAKGKALTQEIPAPVSGLFWNP